VSGESVCQPMTFSEVCSLVRRSKRLAGRRQSEPDTDCQALQACSRESSLVQQHLCACEGNAAWSTLGQEQRDKPAAAIFSGLHPNQVSEGGLFTVVSHGNAADSAGLWRLLPDEVPCTLLHAAPAELQH
jgi:hypothetical protein